MALIDSDEWVVPEAPPPADLVDLEVSHLHNLHPHSDDDYMECKWNMPRVNLVYKTLCLLNHDL